MKFNTDTCKVLHLGTKNIKNNYHLMDTPINSVGTHTNLGVIISNDSKPPFTMQLRSHEDKQKFRNDSKNCQI